MGMSVAAVLLTAGMALGQNALGDGRALDRNTQVGGAGVNDPTRDYLAEMRFRNALVTGNVPGGASFRGDAGYGMAFDFREQVGSDDLFSFRRDSFTSGLAGTGIRGTEALQYQFALTVGNAPPRNLRGSLLTSRTGERLDLQVPSYPIESVSGAVDFRQATPQELGEYEPGTALSLRSISAYTAGRSLGPSMLQMMEGPEGLTEGLVASPLRGLAREELLGDSEGDEWGAGDPQPRERDTESGGRRTGQQTDGAGVAEDVRERLSLDYAARARAIPDALAPTEGGQDPATPAAPAASNPFLEQLASLQQILREGVLVESGEPGEGEAEGAMANRVAGWEDLVDTLKKGVGTIEAPAPTLDRASAYDLHVDRAKTMMEQGRFFEAEQRFTMALAARPNDPLASIGRVHAQIGAGLDLSASANLRAFLVEHPEFVGARYEPGLLPSQERLRVASRRLTEQVTDEEARRASRESALLLAYVSFHLDDRVSTILGLERLGEGESGRRDPLTPLLRAVWLDGQDAKAGQDKPADADTGAGQDGEGDRDR
jgi:hypothetical protein